ncbi:MAG: sigma 54-interacting transcriptional regulator [Myxococcota bacterium]
MVPKTAIQDACDALGVIGDEVREHLTREIPSKVLLRRGTDVVLISGATGAGKEVAAAVCHRSAQTVLGRTGELVPVNCANLSGGLFESELFGHRRGAFTGADRDFGGLIERSKGGTLFLDEVQALEPTDQAKLLRFLGEREYRRVGDDRPRTSDSLIILASNHDLRARAEAGTFRRDLLDRAAAKITLPSLWERRRDIGELAQTFALAAAADAGIEDFMGLTRRARADVEAAVVQAREVSVRRLREIIRDAVFAAAADVLPDALESEHLRPALVEAFGFEETAREAQDQYALEHEFDLLVAREELRAMAGRHQVSEQLIARWCRALHKMVDEMDGEERSYRTLVDRMHRLNKVALWLVSGAHSQAEFRRYFGQLDAQMPTKSVAHQVFYEVHPKTEQEPES